MAKNPKKATKKTLFIFDFFFVSTTTEPDCSHQGNNICISTSLDEPLFTLDLPYHNRRVWRCNANILSRPMFISDDIFLIGIVSRNISCWLARYNKYFKEERFIIQIFISIIKIFPLLSAPLYSETRSYKSDELVQRGGTTHF